MEEKKLRDSIIPSSSRTVILKIQSSRSLKRRVISRVRNEVLCFTLRTKRPFCRPLWINSVARDSKCQFNNRVWNRGAIALLYQWFIIEKSFRLIQNEYNLSTIAAALQIIDRKFIYESRYITFHYRTSCRIWAVIHFRAFFFILHILDSIR